MSRIPKIPTAHVRARRNEREIELLQKRGPSKWVYVGDYDSDPFTTPDSPDWENGYDQAATASGYQRVRFRFDSDGRFEMDGHIDASGGSDGVAAFTLPGDYIATVVRSWLVDVITGSTPASAQVLIPANSGEVQITLL